jgi:hypothetical protein
MRECLSFKREQCPPEIIRREIWLQFRFSLSLRPDGNAPRRGILAALRGVMGRCNGPQLSRIAMSRPVRQVLAVLLVTVMVALQGYGAAIGRHRVEHALDFPGVAYAAMALTDHDHDAPTKSAEPEPGLEAPLENPPIDGDEARHSHHYGGGDVPMALTEAAAAPSAPWPGASAHAPPPGLDPAGLAGDETEHPPKIRA